MTTSVFTPKIKRGFPRTAAAEYIGCSPRTFDSMVAAGRMPEPRLIGSKRVWDRIELDEAFENLPRREVNEWDEDLEGRDGNPKR